MAVTVVVRLKLVAAFVELAATSVEDVVVVAVALPRVIVVADAKYLILNACLFSNYVLNDLNAIASD